MTPERAARLAALEPHITRYVADQRRQRQLADAVRARKACDALIAFLLLGEHA